LIREGGYTKGVDGRVDNIPSIVSTTSPCLQQGTPPLQEESLIIVSFQLLPLIREGGYTKGVDGRVDNISCIISTTSPCFNQDIPKN
jgi:hypothetical protein